MKRDHFLTTLEESVVTSDPNRLDQAMQNLPQLSCPPAEVLGALARGVERARESFRKGSFALPEFLLAIDAYRAGVRSFKACSKQEAPGNEAPQIVIGVVEGDVHDLGKNIVAAVLEACGYRVLDLGRDVPNDKFLEALKSTNASVLALSTMMSTTIENMRELIRTVRKLFPETAVIVGGAPFDPDLARGIGADGYAENAILLPEETRRIAALAGTAHGSAISGHGAT